MKKLIILLAIVMIPFIAFCQIEPATGTTIGDYISNLPFIKDFITAHPWAMIVLTILFVGSEILASIKTVESNSWFQLIKNGIVAFYNKFKVK